MINPKTVVACCALVAALMLRSPAWAQHEASSDHAGAKPEAQTAVVGPSMPGMQPEPPSIYGEQGPPAVPVPNSGGSGVGPSNDTALGRGGTIVPIPPQESDPAEGNPSDDVNAGIASAGTREAARADQTSSEGQGRSFPLWAILIGVVVVVAVLNFLFRMRRPNGQR